MKEIQNINQFWSEGWMLVEMLLFRNTVQVNLTYCWLLSLLCSFSPSPTQHLCTLAEL